MLTYLLTYLLHGASKKNVARVQRIQNALARVVTRTRVTDHIIPALKSLPGYPLNTGSNTSLLLSPSRLAREPHLSISARL